MGIFLSILYTVIFWIIIRNHSFFRLEGVRNESLRWVFLLKVAAGFSLLFVYTYYYTNRSTSDIYKYFDHAKIMYNALFTNPIDYFKMLFGIMNDNAYFTETYYQYMPQWFRSFESNIFSDSHAIIRFNAFVMLFSFGNISVHVVIMAFLSFIGSTAMYKFFIRHSKKSKMGLFFSVFLVPSALFWGSGLMKEGLIFFALGILIYEVDKIPYKLNVFRIFWILFAVLLLMHTKIFIILMIIPLLIAHKNINSVSKQKITLLYLLIVTLFISVGYFSFKQLGNLDAFKMLAQKQNDFIALAQMENAGSLIDESKLEPSFVSILSSIPKALFNGACRPIPFVDNSIIYLPNMFENLCIILAMICCFVFPNNLNRSEKSLINMSLWFVFGVVILTGLTTPILGAIVRYKTIALPFLFSVFVIATDKNKLLAKFPKLTNAYYFIQKKILFRSTIH